MSKRPLFLFIVILSVFLGAMIYFALPKETPLRVVGTSVDNQDLYNPYLPVTIMFNRAPPSTDGLIAVTPAVLVNIAASDVSVNIIPQTTFTPNTQYRIEVYTNPPHTISFVTQDTTQNAPGWNENMREGFLLFEEQAATQDAALAQIRKSVPVAGAGFTVNYSYTDNTYTVTLSSPYEQNRVGFVSWLNGRGINKLTGLRIRYINL
jgi:hypothetical protein